MELRAWVYDAAQLGVALNSGDIAAVYVPVRLVGERYAEQADRLILLPPEFTGGIEEEDGVKYVILGFSYVGMEFPDLDKGGPRDPEPSPEPAPEPKVRPTPTPKTDTPVYRA